MSSSEDRHLSELDETIDLAQRQSWTNLKSPLAVAALFVQGLQPATHN